MTDIVFLVDSEAGHIYPTLKLATSLKEEGFKVAYAGLSDGKELVEMQGFDFYEIFTDIYPKGYSAKIELKKHYSSLLSGCLDTVMKTLDPKILFYSSYMSLEGLTIFYKYNLKPILYCTSFLEGAHDEPKTLQKILSDGCKKIFFKLSGNQPQLFLSLAKEKNNSLATFHDLFSPIDSFPKMVLCPKELKIKQAKTCENEIYLGPGIMEEDPPESFMIDDFLPKGKSLIFLSMGSQIEMYPKKAMRVFEVAVDMMRLPEFANYHMFLSVGGAQIDGLELNSTKTNISVFKWIPQKTVLKRASLAIVHGGMGTVKECIFYGVPMLIAPLGRDQLDNAQRAEHHGLGLISKPNEMNKDILSKKALELINSPEIALKIRAMRGLFRTQNESRKGVEFVKEQIAVHKT